MALRSHCKPKINSSVPTTNCSAAMGMAVSAGPSTAQMAARTTSAAPTPTREERHPRVTPAASTMVSASTISTAEARKLARTRNTPLIAFLPALDAAAPFSEEPVEVARGIQVPDVGIEL